MAWVTKKLGTLAHISRGSSPRPISDTKYFEGGTIPWIKIADATKSGKFLYETKEHVNNYGASFSKKLPPGTILVAASGTLGYTQILGVEGCAHDGWLILQNLNGLDRDFTYYALKTFEQHFFNSAYGAAIQNINTEILRGTEFPAPPLATQRRIAGILSAYDDLIENCQRRIQILEEMARSLYREWFVNFRYPGYESVPLVPSPLGEIPQGWEVRKVKEVATVTYGFPFSSKKFNSIGIGAPVIRIRDVPEGLSATFTEENAELKYHVDNGHILVGMDGDFHMCIWASGHAFQNQRVARFESNGEIGNLHLFLALEKPIQEFNKAIVGTTVAHLGDMHIKTIQIVWPPAELRAKAREVLEPMSDRVIELKRQIQNLRRTRDLLLPRLMSGQLEVTVD
jgi:type I restriction enzyme S subunit